MESVSEAWPRRGRARCERWGVMHCFECCRRECRKAAVRLVAVVRSDLPIKFGSASSMKTLKKVGFHDICISMCLLGAVWLRKSPLLVKRASLVSSQPARDVRFLVRFPPWPSRCHQQLTAQEAWLRACFFFGSRHALSPRGREVWTPGLLVHVTSLIWVAGRTKI